MQMFCKVYACIIDHTVILPLNESFGPVVCTIYKLPVISAVICNNLTNQRPYTPHIAGQEGLEAQQQRRVGGPDHYLE